MKFIVLIGIAAVVAAGCGRIEFTADTTPPDVVTDAGADAPDAPDAPDACAACGECESCAGGGCQPASDGMACAEGVCVSGACCAPTCGGSVCGDDGCGGVCGTCATGERCSAGACEVTVCETDTDCLECETCDSNTCIPLADATTCTGGLCYGGACCAGCYNGTACQTGDTISACSIAGDTCTTCGIPANGTASCPGGSCEYACLAGYADCNTDPSDGCEIDLTGDRDHCGACGVPCTGECRTCAASLCASVSDATPCTDGMCMGGTCIVDPCRGAAGVGAPACRLLNIEHSGIGANGFGRVWRGQDIAFPMAVVVTGVEFQDQTFVGDRMDEIRLMTSVGALSTLASSTTITAYDADAISRWHQVTFAAPVPLLASVEYTAWFHLTSTAVPTRGCNLFTVTAGWGGHHTDLDPNGESSASAGNWDYQYGTNLRVYGYVP